MEENNEQGKKDGHGHSHGGILGKNTELYFAILSGATLITGFLLEKFTGISDNIPFGLYLAAYFLVAFSP